MNTFIAVISLAVCVALLLWRQKIVEQQERRLERAKQGLVCWHGEPILDCQTCTPSSKSEFSRAEWRRAEMHNRKFLKRISKKGGKLDGIA